MEIARQFERCGPRRPVPDDTGRRPVSVSRRIPGRRHPPLERFERYKRRWRISAAIASVAYSAMAAAYGTSVTTTGITTTGATLLVAGTAYSPAGAGMSVTDSNSNTWNSLTAYQYTSGGYTQIWYSYSKSGGALSLGSGHTFTLTSTATCRLAIAVAAYSGTLTTSSVYVQSTGGSANASPVSSGSLTPASGDLLVSSFSGNGVGGTGLSVSSPFTLEASNTANWDGGFADYFPASGASENATWSITGDSALAASLAEFAAAAAFPPDDDYWAAQPSRATDPTVTVWG